MPCSIARRAAPSAESAAAYGVLLREPLKPATPAEPQLITAPVRSVIVMIVLLNVAWMWTCPWGTFFRSRRRCFTARFRSAMLLFGYLGLLLPPHADRLLRSTPLAGIGLGSLAARRQVASMAHPAVRADLDEPLDVEGDLAAEIAFHLVAAIDQLAEPVDLLFGEIADTRVRIDIRLGQD